MSRRLIESIEDTRYNWIRELFENVTSNAGSIIPDEVIAYRRVAKTIYALARAGRVILVGRGSAFITEEIPNGVHIRLVAPFEDRVERFQKERGLSRSEAEKDLKQLDEKHQDFFNRFWPDRPLTPENVTVTFNTARIDEAHIADAALPLIGDLRATRRHRRQQPVAH